MKRRTFIKAIAIGASLSPVLVKLAEASPPTGIRVFIKGQEVAPFTGEVSVKAPHTLYTDGWADLIGITRKSNETDRQLRGRILLKLKGE